jgi:hypothetical protein
VELRYHSKNEARPKSQMSRNKKFEHMKKIKFITIILALGFILTSFIGSSEKNKSIVDQKEGLYIFILSKPVAEYEYLGSVKKILAWSGKPDEMLNSMIRKVKKDYPKADGIVFTSIDMDKADAIQFKN